MSEGTVDSDSDQLLTTDQAAELLGLCSRTLERHRAAGSGPKFCKLSRRVVRYRRSAIREYLDGRSFERIGEYERLGLAR